MVPPSDQQQTRTQVPNVPEEADMPHDRSRAATQPNAARSPPTKVNLVRKQSPHHNAVVCDHAGNQNEKDRSARTKLHNRAVRQAKPDAQRGSSVSEPCKQEDNRVYLDQNKSRAAAGDLTAAFEDALQALHADNLASPMQVSPKKSPKSADAERTPNPLFFQQHTQKDGHAGGEVHEPGHPSASVQPRALYASELTGARGSGKQKSSGRSFGKQPAKGHPTKRCVLEVMYVLPLIDVSSCYWLTAP